MIRDVRERVSMYARRAVEVRHLGLTLDQVRCYQPPPNTAKEAAKLYAGYVARFGTDECWELDALPPAVIADLVRREVESLIDYEAWAEALQHEIDNREQLRDAMANWSKVENFLRRRAECGDHHQDV